MVVTEQRGHQLSPARDTELVEHGTEVLLYQGRRTATRVLARSSGSTAAATSACADGVLNVVCPVMDSSELCGVGIYDASADEVEAFMQSDPGVVAGVFRYEVHPCRSFPGDALA